MEDMLTKFMLVTQNEFLQVNGLQNLLNAKHVESMKRLEGSISNLSKQNTSIAHERGDCDAIELRNHTVPFVPSMNKQKRIMEQSSEKDEETKTKPTEEGVSRETIVRGDKLDKFIDKDSPFRRTKQQIINEPNPDLPNYIKPPNPFIKKKPKREMEVGSLKSSCRCSQCYK